MKKLLPTLVLQSFFFLVVFLVVQLFLSARHERRVSMVSQTWHTSFPSGLWPQDG